MDEIRKYVELRGGIETLSEDEKAALFEAASGPYDIAYDEGRNDFRGVFSADGRKRTIVIAKHTTPRQGEIEVLGKGGNPIRVFSTVAMYVKKIFSGGKLDAVFFTVDKNRSDVYRKLLKRAKVHFEVGLDIDADTEGSVARRAKNERIFLMAGSASDLNRISGDHMWIREDDWNG